jgi:hypothetical protein
MRGAPRSGRASPLPPLPVGCRFRIHRRFNLNLILILILNFNFNFNSRAQLGLQHTDDSVLVKVNRESTRADAVTAIARLKDACYKVGRARCNGSTAPLTAL